MKTIKAYFTKMQQENIMSSIIVVRGGMTPSAKQGTDFFCTFFNDPLKRFTL